MVTQAETRAERASRMLAEAGEIMLSAMRQLNDKLAAAETPEAAAQVGLALQRVNRGLRQTLLLEARLESEVGEARRAAAAQEAKAREDEVQRTIHKVRLAAGREILEACDSEEDAEKSLRQLEDGLEAYVRGFDFTKGALEDLVEMLLHDLGFEREESPEETEEAGPEAAPADEAPAEEASTDATPPEPPAPPPGPRLVQRPDLGWAPADSS